MIGPKDLGRANANNPNLGTETTDEFGVARPVQVNPVPEPPQVVEIPVIEYRANTGPILGKKKEKK